MNLSPFLSIFFILFISCDGGNAFLKQTGSLAPISSAPTSKTLEDLMKEIPGQKLWLDSNNVLSIKSDDQCSITAQTGDPVGCWLDLSGNSNHVIQDTASKSPTFMNEGVLFDGNDFLIDADGGDYINGSDGFEIIAIVQSDEINSDRAFWDTEKRDNQDDLPSFRYDNKGWLNNCDNCMKIGVKTDKGASASESGSYIQTLDKHLVDASWSTGSYPKIYDQGIETVSSNPVNVSGVITGATRVMIGDGTKKAWKGKILEILYYDHELSGDERQTVINYLNDKWQL